MIVFLRLAASWWHRPPGTGMVCSGSPLLAVGVSVFFPLQIRFYISIWRAQQRFSAPLLPHSGKRALGALFSELSWSQLKLVYKDISAGLLTGYPKCRCLKFRLSVHQCFCYTAYQKWFFVCFFCVWVFPLFCRRLSSTWQSWVFTEELYVHCLFCASILVFACPLVCSTLWFFLC